MGPLAWLLLSGLAAGVGSGAMSYIGEERKTKAARRVTAKEARERSRALATLVASEKARARQQQAQQAFMTDPAMLEQMLLLGFPAQGARRVADAGGPMEAMMAGMDNADPEMTDLGLRAATGNRVNLEALRRAASPPPSASPILSALGLPMV